MTPSRSRPYRFRNLTDGRYHVIDIATDHVIATLQRETLNGTVIWFTDPDDNRTWETRRAAGRRLHEQWLTLTAPTV